MSCFCKLQVLFKIDRIEADPYQIRLSEKHFNFNIFKITIGMSLKISRILHAGYVFENGQDYVVFDPIFENPFSRNCYAFPSVNFDYHQIKNLKLNAVFISHFHDDHCSLESLNYLNREVPIYIYCQHNELPLMIQQLGFLNVYQIQIDQPVVVGSFVVTPRRALDSDVDSIFQIQVAGLNILNVVDSWIDVPTLDQLVKFSPWDLVLWPFQTMREIEVLSPRRANHSIPEIPIEWIQQLQLLNPRYIVPSSCQFIQESWSWYNHSLFPISYKQFEAEVESKLPGARVVKLNPSISLTLNHKSLEYAGVLNWVLPVGEQDLDYEYKPDLQPPTTAEISINFPELDSQKSEKVYNYCENTLIEKYNSMDPPEDFYFNKIRHWKLSIYNHLGESKDFYYTITKGRLETISEVIKPLSWLTEVPLAKLYAALDSGESLTSMYVRINDTVFDAGVEKEIKNVDVLEDPLIRCLFNGVFGSYQAAQLKKILE